MVDLGTVAMAIFGIVSIHGYLLLVAVLVDYVWFQRRGRSTPIPAPVSTRLRSIRVGAGDRLHRLRTAREAPAAPSNRCPNCGQRNDPAFRFCHHCVSRLGPPER